MIRRALLILLLATSVHAQSILTVAGGGPIGDGKVATDAVLRIPADVAVDAAGNLFIVDSRNQRIRRVEATTGRISTFAGGGTSGPGEGGPATAAEVYPNAVAIHPNGDIYISEGLRVRKVPGGGGNIVTVVGGGGSREDGVPATQAFLNGANDLAFDRAGNLYIAFPYEDRVRKVDVRTGLITTVAGTGQPGFSGDGGPATAAQMDFPWTVAIDSTGNLLIGDWGRQTQSNQGRVRRVDTGTGIITTIAGGGSGFPRDTPVPARELSLGFVSGLAAGSGGSFFVNVGNVLRVDSFGMAVRYAGGGPEDFDGDGGPALGSSLNFPAGIATDASENLFIADSRNQRVRRVDAKTNTITTAAGSGAPDDDGSPGTSAALFEPSGIAIGPDGGVYFSEYSNYRVRKLDLTTGLISTVAGVGKPGYTGDGGPATAARIREPWGIAFDPAGNLYVNTRVGQVRRVDRSTGVMTTVVGNVGDYSSGFAGDGGPAASALINHAVGITFDRTGNMYLADTENLRIRKVDAQTSVITTIAGSGLIGPLEGGFSGDGGLATQALLNRPRSVAVDVNGDVFIADTGNGRIRKVSAQTGIITTVAGVGLCCDAPRGDGGPAASAQLSSPNAVTFDAGGNLLIGENASVRRVERSTGIITTIAGDFLREGVALPAALGGFTGDSGPAVGARLSLVTGIAFNAKGDLFVADSNNNRVRAVFACVTVAALVLTAPAPGATAVGSAPTLTWEKAAGAFRYDVYLSTTEPPARLVASDLTATSFTPANLLPGTRYYWRVVAKGDPFCPAVSVAPSEVRSFTTDASCTAPAAVALMAPPDGASNQSANVQLIWAPAAGAGSYDVLLGTINPPPLAATVPITTYDANGLAAATTYYWSVVARAACDASKTTAAPIRSFRTGGTCPAPGAFTQTAPLPGATNVSTTATLEWSASPNATSYDLYLGTTSPPPIYLLDLAATRLTISGLAPGQTYHWRVTAKAACDASRTVSTPVANFRIRSGCTSPRATSFTFAPPAVAAGQTYVVAWNDAGDLEPDGYYVVERSLSDSFSSVIDTQQTQSNSTSFVGTSPGTHFHRVRPVNPCNLEGGQASNARSVSIVPAPSNVIFTVQPEAVLTTLGEKLEDKKSRFVIENIGSETMTVILGRQEIDSAPYFTVIDPFGGDSSIMTLEPRKPKELEIRFSGPANDRAASYQGVIFLAAIGKGLAVTPYAFVNLRVGGSDTATPVFRVGGLRSEYAFFPGRSGDDATRAPITVEIHNPGSTPMELGAEVGPELWLVPESGWNATAIPAGASRIVRLFTRRTRAPNGSALPRYTHFTVRSKTGRTARLLVQDNDAPPVGNGRGVALDPSVRSLIVPEVVGGETAGGRRFFSTVRLSNVGADSVTAELFFTPSNADGFDETRVRRAAVIVPGNDVVTLSDPLLQLWGIPSGAGQLEIRSNAGRIAQITARALVVQPAENGGAHTYTVPTVSRGEGARSGAPHHLTGITADSTIRAALTIAETSGVDRATVRAVLIDSEGVNRGETSIEVARYGATEVADVLAAFGAGALITAGRLELTVTSGGGIVISIVKLIDRNNGGAATLVSSPITTAVTTQSLRGRFRRTSHDAASRTWLLPAAFNGALAAGSTVQYRTAVGLVAGAETTTFRLTYRDESNTRTATVTVAPRKTGYYGNVLEQLMQTPAGASADGSLTIESSPAGEVWAQLTGSTSGVTLATVNQALPVTRTDSEFITSPGSQRLLYLDGIDQSVDPERGNRWALILNEVAGKNMSVVISLYEAGNRTSPIVQREFPIPPYWRLKMENVFAALGLDEPDRRKDRANMLLSVAYKSGAGAAAAMLVSIDNRTGDSRSHLLAPASGSGINVQKATVAVAPPGVGRRRSVKQ